MAAADASPSSSLARRMRAVNSAGSGAPSVSPAVPVDCERLCWLRDNGALGPVTVSDRPLPLAGTTELLDSGRTWDLSVNEAKGSPVTRLRLRSSRWTSCHLNPSNGLLIQNDRSEPPSRNTCPSTARASTSSNGQGHLQGTLARFFLADTLIHLHRRS